MRSFKSKVAESKLLSDVISSNLSVSAYESIENAQSLFADRKEMTYKVYYLGTHKSRADSRRHNRGKGGGGGFGGGSGGGSSAEGNKEYNNLKKTTDTRIEDFLKSKKYSQASILAASMAFTSIPTDEIASVLLAGISALKEGKRTEWQPKAEEIARTAIEASENVTKYQFSKESKNAVTEALVKELKKGSGGVQ